MAKAQGLGIGRSGPLLGCATDVCVTLGKTHDLRLETWLLHERRVREVECL